MLEATGLTTEEIDEFAARYLKADRVIITWAMGLTQHKQAVPTIKEIINLLLLRGNIGKPGAGASPIRGHSNVQGDRTMGVWEKMPPDFLDALEKEFGFNPPRKHGVDSVQAIRGDARRQDQGLDRPRRQLCGSHLRHRSRGGGVPKDRNDGADLDETEPEPRRHRRGGADPADDGPQRNRPAGQRRAIPLGRGLGLRRAFLTRGRVDPISRRCCPRCRSSADSLGPTLGNKVDVDWAGFESNYDTIRDHIARVVPGFANYNQLVRQDGGFILPHGPRDSRTFTTATGKAKITVNELEYIQCPPGRLLLQTMRSHDQFNTTIYSLNDRYRGIKKGRKVIFVHPDDLAALGIENGDLVDVHSEFSDNVDRVVHQFRTVAFPTSRGCAAAYFPEANPLVPLDFTADGSNTPASKSVVVRLEPSKAIRESATGDNRGRPGRRLTGESRQTGEPLWRLH